MKEDGLLPLPKEISKVGACEFPRGWRPGVGSASRPMMDRETLGGASPFLPRLEGSVVVHPCCRTSCSVLTASAASPNVIARFGGKK